MSLKDDVTEAVLSMSAGALEGTKRAKRRDLHEYVSDLVVAKGAGLSMDLMPDMEWVENHNIYVEAMLSQSAKTGVEGGVIWSLINVSGEYKKEEQSAFKVSLDLHYRSKDEPNYAVLKSMSIEDAKVLMEVVEKDS